MGGYGKEGSSNISRTLAAAPRSAISFFQVRIYHQDVDWLLVTPLTLLHAQAIAFVPSHATGHSLAWPDVSSPEETYATWYAGSSVSGNDSWSLILMLETTNGEAWTGMRLTIQVSETQKCQSGNIDRPSLLFLALETVSPWMPAKPPAVSLSSTAWQEAARNGTRQRSDDQSLKQTSA